MGIEWTNIPFGQLYKIPSRNGLNRPGAVRGEGYRMINMGELFGNDRISDLEMERVKLNDREMRDFEVLEHDLLFARQSIVAEGAGKCSLVIEVPEYTCFESHIIRVRLDVNKASPMFYYYLFQSQLGKAYLSTIRLQGVQAGIRGSDLVNLELPYPKLEEQQHIASVLSNYDDLIENNNKRIAILEQMAEQIYKEWFVRMRFPGYEYAEFEKGVPKGWLKELGNYIKVVKGKSYTGEEINEIGEGKPFVNLKSFNRGGGYRYDGIKFYTGKYNEKQVVREGDIVMAVTDMTQDRAVVGRVARIPKTEFSEMIISLDSAKIVPDKKLPNAFFYATLRFGFFGNTIKEFANGSNVLHLKPDLAYQMKSIIPDDEALIKKFDKLIEPYFNLIDNLNLENQNLKKTRDLLLPRLISGKLKVKDLGAVTKKEKV
jgi:type I restriction enzyme S subunit